MKVRSLFILALALILSISAFGQLTKTNLASHNIGGTLGCKSCHAPHNGSAAISGTDQSTGRILLWDRAISTTVYGTYDSPSMKNKAVEIGGTTLPSATDARIYSLLCMSCHDGALTPTGVSVGADKAVGSGSTTTSSYGLRNDHPVNMSHDATVQPTLVDAATVTGANGLTLYGTSNTVQCASCHEPHNLNGGDFLRAANTNGTALCLKCHK